jgi:hypothetical protein
MDLQAFLYLQPVQIQLLTEFLQTDWVHVGAGPRDHGRLPKPVGGTRASTPQTH